MRQLATVLVGALVLAGCGVGGDRAEIRQVTTGFLGALRAGDGGAACAALSPALQQQIAKQGPCLRVLRRAQVRGRGPGQVLVYIGSGRVRLLGGDTLFLDRLRDGWKVSALGCRPTGSDTVGMAGTRGPGVHPETALSVSRRGRGRRAWSPAARPAASSRSPGTPRPHPACAA